MLENLTILPENMLENLTKTLGFVLENLTKYEKNMLENLTNDVLLIRRYSMIKRKIDQKIRDWIANGKDALLITGVRQCGKSTSIRNILKETKTDYVEINLIERKNLVSVFNSAIEKSSSQFLMELEVSCGKTLKKNTIIFLDEIQEIKEVVTIIKFLVENGKYRYILSGSLLGVELQDLRSAPVGYMRTIDMYPMDLEEFLKANGLGDDVIQMLNDCYTKRMPVSEVIHEYLIDAFYRYLIIGGMPEAVQTFIETNDYNAVADVHRKIIREYYRDFTKYEKEKKLKLIKTYDLIPSELDAKNKRYTFSNLGNDSIRFDRYENNFNWLNDAGVSISVYNVTEFQIPLRSSKKSNLFKMFLSDVGMLTTTYGSATVLKLLDHGNSINCGAMFENAVAQELKAHGFEAYYFNNKKHGEVDFLIENEEELLPIEVKSGKDYQKHSALTYFMSTKQFNKAYVFSNHNVSINNDIIYLPIYMAMFLQNNKKIDIKKEKFDLSFLSDLH